MPDRRAIKKALLFSAGLLVLIPLCLVLWGYVLPYYAEALGLVTAPAVRLLLGAPVDSVEAKKNIEGAMAYAQLAADVGAQGIKVRPNGFPEGVDREKTLEQIGNALRQVATFSQGIGIPVRLEVHGKDTSDPRNIRKIMDYADHPGAVVCWNSNASDMDENKSIEWSFNLLKDKIAHCHITEIGIYQYPWQDLFNRLKGIDYQGYCLAEIPYNEDPERFMQYYRTLYDLYTGGYKWPQ